MADSIIDAAAQVISVYEGFKNVPYYDGSAKYSIGYGFCWWNGRPVTATYPVSITQQEAIDNLRSLVGNILKKINALVKVKLSSNQLIALCSFCYNVGIPAFQNSTMLKDINAGDFASASTEFPKWNLSGGKVIPGLTNRRAAEQKLFQTP